VGFTRPPGAGKSTLIDAYIAEPRKAGRSVAVARKSAGDKQDQRKLRTSVRAMTAAPDPISPG
jgi:hypothetical protein